ncbi:hypothetical protein PUNSTDRAFT_128995 [Punctularia strigosozonata HHB-11173 SS5]|uniref:uncharacterized protein n=1 Tax=Punctularia strigosozonata (strain HHB-11173) TaxID=741275 RepID=UPI0004417493|nr:uncharacterized protein PUNSTDRAFT_128995 [Punctularia strigosozonata HHB-11173 SS5]EIN13306.1 hypothetical protein PUNSTDRAFT_128995 [Punctularia strigosozonata HHB-11173 SS5]
MKAAQKRGRTALETPVNARRKSSRSQGHKRTVSTSSATVTASASNKAKNSSRRHNKDQSDDDDEANLFMSSKANGGTGVTEDESDFEADQRNAAYWKYRSIEDIHTKGTDEEQEDAESVEEQEDEGEAEPVSKRRRVNAKHLPHYSEGGCEGPSTAEKGQQDNSLTAPLDTIIPQFDSAV